MKLRTDSVLTSGVKKVASVSYGSLVAQLSVAATLPILTRLYDQADIGRAAFVVAVVAVVTTIGAARFEVAIPLPEADSTARALLRLSTIAAAVTSLATGVLYTLFRGHGVAGLGALGPESTLLVIVFAFTAITAAVTRMLTLRDRKYGTISSATIAKAAAQLAVQVLLGVRGWDASGLLAGYAAGSAAATIWQLRASSLTTAAAPLLATARTYRGYPLHTGPGTLVNVVTMQAPILYLGARFGADPSSFAGLTRTLVAMPLTLVTQSAGLVLYGEWGRGRADDRGRLLGQARRLLLVGGGLVAAYLVAAVIGARLFATVVFGPGWAPLGDYVLVLGFFHAAAAVVNPIAAIPDLVGATVTNLVRSLARAAAVGAGLAAAALLADDPIPAAVALSAGGVLGSALFGWFSLTPLRRRNASSTAASSNA